MPLHPGAGRQSVNMPGARFRAGNVRRATPMRAIYAPCNNEVNGIWTSKFILKADVISYFEDCNLKEEDLEFLFHDRCRPRFMHVDFDSEDSIQKSLKITSAKGRLGGKFMKLEQDSHIELDETNLMVQSPSGSGVNFLLLTKPLDA